MRHTEREIKKMRGMSTDDFRDIWRCELDGFRLRVFDFCDDLAEKITDGEPFTKLVVNRVMNEIMNGVELGIINAFTAKNRDKHIRVDLIEIKDQAIEFLNNQVDRIKNDSLVSRPIKSDVLSFYVFNELLIAMREYVFQWNWEINKRLDN